MNILIVLIIYFTAQITTQNQPKQKINITSTSGTSTTTVTNNISVNPTEDSEDDTLTVSVTTETLLTTACEGNSSCFVSTEKPELNSSVALKNDSRSGDILYQQGRSNYKTSGVDLCTCNLQRNFCDINCCCDEDCSINDKSIFNHCEPENFYYDTRYCDYMKYIYINNTPFQWHVNQNGLFCILKSNLPPSHTVQRKHPLKTFADAEVEKVNKFSWQRNFESKELSFNPAERFVYGSNIWMVHKNGIKKFRIKRERTPRGIIKINS